RERYVFGGLAEIALGSGFDTIGAGAEINPVEVELENLSLGMLALEPKRKFNLLQFPLQRALLGQEQILGKLLGKRRSALRNAAMQNVGDRRTRNPDRIDAAVRIEAAIFDGDEGFRQIRRKILQRDIGARHFAANRK